MDEQLRTARADIERLEHDKAALEKDRADVKTQRDSARADCDKVTSERDALKAQLATQKQQYEQQLADALKLKQVDIGHARSHIAKLEAALKAARNGQHTALGLPLPTTPRGCAASGSPANRTTHKQPRNRSMVQGVSPPTGSMTRSPGDGIGLPPGDDIGFPPLPAESTQNDGGVPADGGHFGELGSELGGLLDEVSDWLNSDAFASQPAAPEPSSNGDVPQVSAPSNRPRRSSDCPVLSLAFPASLLRAQMASPAPLALTANAEGAPEDNGTISEEDVSETRACLPAYSALCGLTPFRVPPCVTVG